MGQNVNSYGNDLGKKDAFARLLERVSEIDGIERIRFMSSHPKDLSDDLLLTMARLEKVPNQLHLPVQSGSDKVLKDMNRRYTHERYMSLVNRARELMEDVALTTDIIVGFPTETEEDFEDTLTLLKEVKFDSIFSFIYSPRENTPAAKIPPVSTLEEIEKRFARLLEVQNAISLERNKTYLGKTQSVLVEGASKTDPEMMTGRNYANKIVNFKGDKSLKDTFADIKITKAQTWILYGELENK